MHVSRLHRDPLAMAAVAARFAAEGLARGEAVILVLTPDSKDAVWRHLQADDPDLERRVAEGRLVLVDAAEALGLLAPQGRISVERFEEVAGQMLDEAERRAPRARIYGELVQILAEMGSYTESARLESLWDDLARRRAFSLLCAYRVTPYDPEFAGLVRRVCAAHGYAYAVEDLRYASALEQALTRELGASEALKVATSASRRSGPRAERVLDEVRASNPAVLRRVLRRAQDLYELAA